MLVVKKPKLPLIIFKQIHIKKKKKMINFYIKVGVIFLKISLCQINFNLNTNYLKIQQMQIYLNFQM